MKELAWGILGGLFTLIVRELIEYIKSLRGEYTGSWHQIIYDENGKIVKKDMVKLKHIGKNVKGTIRRIMPAEQRGKAWKFEGKVRDNLLFGIFWTTDNVNNPKSYGTLQLYIVNPNYMRGHYTRIKDYTDNEEWEKFKSELQVIKFEWKRIS